MDNIEFQKRTIGILKNISEALNEANSWIPASGEYRYASNIKLSHIKNKINDLEYEWDNYE